MLPVLKNTIPRHPVSKPRSYFHLLILSTLHVKLPNTVNSASNIHFLHVQKSEERSRRQGQGKKETESSPIYYGVCNSPLQYYPGLCVNLSNDKNTQVRHLIPFSDNLLKHFCYWGTPPPCPVSLLLLRGLKPKRDHSPQVRSDPCVQEKRPIISTATFATEAGLQAVLPCLWHLQFRWTNTLCTSNKTMLNKRLTALEGLTVEWRRQTWTGLGNRILLPQRGNFSTLLTVIQRGDYLILERMYE